MSYYTRGEDVLTVISNVFLLIPAATAIIYRRWLRSIILIIETVVSGLMHLCDSFGVCAFSFEFLHNADFFFAQWIIVLVALLIPYWSLKYQWLEYWLILLGGVLILVLQVLFDGQLFVQAILVGACALGIIVYWLVYRATTGQGHLPPYHWGNFGMGLFFLSLSIIFFVTVGVWPEGYWALHSLWHITASLGFHYFLQIKPPGPYIIPTAERISHFLVRRGLVEKPLSLEELQRRERLRWARSA